MLLRVDGPLRARPRHDRDRLSRSLGGACRASTAGSPARAAGSTCELGSDARLFQSAAARRGVRARPPRRLDAASRPYRDGDAARSARPRPARFLHASRFRIPRTRVPARVEPSSTDTRAARDQVPRLHRRREDRVRRQPALARADRDRQLHPRLARRAGRGGRRPARDRRVRADEPRRPAPHPRGARGHPADDEAAAAAVRAPLAAGVEPRRPAAGRALSRPDRRAALHRLDVPAAARRPALDDDPRPRAAAPPRMGHAAHLLDALGEVSRCAELRHRVRQLRVHAAAT